MALIAGSSQILLTVGTVPWTLGAVRMGEMLVERKNDLHIDYSRGKTSSLTKFCNDHSSPRVSF